MSDNLNGTQEVKIVRVRVLAPGLNVTVEKEVADGAETVTVAEALAAAGLSVSSDMVFRSRAALLSKDSELRDGDTVLAAHSESNG